MKKNNTNATSNPYKVGDVVYISWGYDMTIVQFYRVTRVTPSKVGLVELGSTEQGYYGECKPRLDVEIPGNSSPYSAHEDALYKVNQWGIRIPSYRGGHDYKTAGRWDGQGVYYNHMD